MQDRELVSDPTNQSARNGQNTKSFNMARLLTTARGWHGAFTPAHEVSQNRPKQSGPPIDIFIYNRVDTYLLLLTGFYEYEYNKQQIEQGKVTRLPG